MVALGRHDRGRVGEVYRRVAAGVAAARHGDDLHADAEPRAGLHRTGVRRYYASKEELLLELAERGWRQWSAAINQMLGDREDLQPRDVAAVLADTIASLPVFCDLLTHVTLSLEGDVDIERARPVQDQLVRRPRRDRQRTGRREQHDNRADSRP